MKDLFLKLEHLVGLHPDDPNYKVAKADIARIQKDALKPAESAQLESFLTALEAARLNPPAKPA